MVDHDDELLAAVRDLTRTIDDLQQELESTQRRSRRRPPTLRPPTPRELLAFTDEVALPATIAILEASVRALEGFQRALALARTERDVRDRTTEATSATSKRASELRQTTLSQLDGVLARLQQAATDGTLPADEGARELLTEARELRDDVDSRLRDVGTDVEQRQADATDSIRIDIQEGHPNEPEDSDDPASRVDVDAELETLKDQYGDESEDSSDTDNGESGSANDENGAASENDETTVPENDDDADPDGTDSGR